MTFKFKVGDKVRHRSRCPYPLTPVLHNKILTITKINEGDTKINEGDYGQYFLFAQVQGQWSVERFQPVEVYRKPQEAKKDDTDKSRLDILFGCRGIDQVGHVFAYGAKKYEEYNWRKSGNDDSYKRRLVGAALRHLFAYLTGNRTDAETGKSNLAHAIADLAMVIDLENS